MHRRAALALALVPVLAPTAPAETLDWEILGRIRDEGFRRSQVMETAAQLTDVHGPRLTGSPQYRKAAEWARQQLESWGLADARLEPFPFGRGWSLERCSAHVVAPVAFPLVALPQAWTAGTEGPRRGRVLRVRAGSEADVEKLRGQVAGKVLWLGETRELKGPEEGGVFRRYTDAQLDDIERYAIPGARGRRGAMGPAEREAYLARRRVRRALEKLWAEERPIAVVEPSDRDANVLRLGGGGSRKEGEEPAVTRLVAAAAQWNRVARLLDRGTEVEFEVDVAATFHDDDTSG
jgi:carboxypeptidase Q